MQSTVPIQQNNYDNIPDELKVIKAWLCWRYEEIGSHKPTKVPYNPITNKHADVKKPETWVSFETASKALGYSGIGYVFHAEDNYSFIDLDSCRFLPNAEINPNYQFDLNRQIKIFNEFESYSEISPSGEGLHIIVKGKIPSGRRRSFIEVYSSERYATFTGNVYKHKQIKDCQDKLIQLWEQVGSGPIATNLYQGDDVERIDDNDVIQQAKEAINGDKFNHLLYGNWQHLYTSQSEADYALIDILAFYTQNKKQINRIFLSSGLGKRTKAKRSDYIERMILRSFDRMLPPIDLDGFKNIVEDKLAEKQLNLPLTKKFPIVHEVVTSQAYDIPPGLVGEIAQFIYQASPRPVPEIALAGAIGLMAGIAGRAYNVNGEGLNQYILLIAQSGTGKESMASGIDKLMNSIKLQIPTSTRIIGPAEITSGEALIKYLNNQSQCFVSILSEFGYRLQSLTDKNNPAQRSLKQILLDLYHKSGNGRVFRPKIYADKDKNISETISPAFSILAETTPSTFYETITEEMVADGFLPRFTIIEYKGLRVPTNDNCSTTFPANWLVDKIGSFVANCEVLNYHKRVINIPISKEADAELRRFDKYGDAIINQNEKENIRQLWNRAHIKAWKLAGLIAVGVNMIEPEITLENVKWALKLVYEDINTLSSKFEAGEIGNNTQEIRQNRDIIKAFKDYLIQDWTQVHKYCKDMKVQKMHSDKIIPYSFLNRKLISMASFRNDRNGATFALKRAIQILLDSDKLREANKQELAFKYGTTQRAFVVADVSIFD